MILTLLRGNYSHFEVHLLRLHHDIDLGLLQNNMGLTLHDAGLDRLGRFVVHGLLRAAPCLHHPPLREATSVELALVHEECRPFILFQSLIKFLDFLLIFLDFRNFVEIDTLLN